MLVSLVLLFYHKLARKASTIQTNILFGLLAAAMVTNRSNRQAGRRQQQLRHTSQRERKERKKEERSEKERKKKGKKKERKKEERKRELDRVAVPTYDFLLRYTHIRKNLVWQSKPRKERGTLSGERGKEGRKRKTEGERKRDRGKDRERKRERKREREREERRIINSSK